MDIAKELSRVILSLLIGSLLVKVISLILYIPKSYQEEYFHRFGFRNDLNYEEMSEFK